MRKKRLSCVVTLIFIGLLLVALDRLNLLDPVVKQIDQAKYQLLPTPTPTVTPEPTPYVGQVGQRTAHSGWAITVANVKRTNLNPVQIVPKVTRIDDEYDYIYMDVTVERTVDERGSIVGDYFTLLDGAGNKINKDYSIYNWLYGGDQYFGSSVTDRIAFRVPRSIQDFTLRLTPFPKIPEPLEVTLDKITSPRRVSLQEAIDLGLLKAGVRGVSLESIEVEVSLEVEEELELSILPGTTFLAPSPDLQTMVVRYQANVFLEEKDEVTLDISVACANMHLEAPSGGEEYIVKIEPPAEELRKLMGLSEFRGASFRLQQFAIWTVTDKPARGAYVGLSSGGGQGSGPSNDELNTIAGWFEAAGLSLEEYPSLRR